MKFIRKQLEKDLAESVEDVRFFSVRGMDENVDALENTIEDIKAQLAILEEIERDGEGNLLRFNEDGSFEMWCVRIPEGDSELVEHYEANLDFASYESVIQEAACVDVTTEFRIADIAHRIFVIDDLNACEKQNDNFYFVSNDTIEDMLSPSL